MTPGYRRSHTDLPQPRRTTRAGSPPTLQHHSHPGATLSKQPFDIHAAIRLLRRATQSLTPAAMFQLADEGYRSLFEQLIAAMISIRTLEETTLPTCRNFFAVARTPAAVAALTPRRIDELIRACTFHEGKSKQIHTIAVRIVNELHGDLPCDFDLLTSFNGVGPKVANLALGIACGEPHGVPVDIHVHRITNRWGYIAATTPEQTGVHLEGKMPKRYWMEINRLLVPFGKSVCTGQLPRCSTCPLLAMCQQVGVTDHR